MEEEMPLKEAEETPPENNGKKKRKRVKHLCTAIRTQMEFYFSESSLHKDRFLGSLIKQSPDGYVDLEVFSRFNKLRSITTDMKLVAKALSTSELLQVSEDKLRVKRTKPLGDVSDMDDRTVYVEFLPPKVTHDWIKQQFSVCGKVQYVSLPKFRSTGDPKGFAFVEFSSKSEAQGACEMLNNPPVTVADRVGRFPRTNKQLEQLQKKLPPGGVNDDNAVKGKDEEGACRNEAEKTTTEPQEKTEEKEKNKDNNKEGETPGQKPEHKKKKRKRKSTDSTDTKVEKIRKVSEIETEAPPTGDVLKTSDQNSQKTPAGGDTEKVKKTKRVRISDAVEISIAEPTKKKRRKKKDKTKEKEKTLPKDIPELRVIPKHEWLMLRKEYLMAQKQSMSALKKNLTAIKNASKKKNKSAERKGNEESRKEPKKTLEFVANVIVKLESSQPTDRKAIKASLGGVGNIAYIDVDQSEHLAHIRCQDPESATSVATKGIDGYTLKLLQGEEESGYWDKLRADQEQKLSRPRSKKRGTRKVVEKADRAREGNPTRAKHVVFDD